MKVPGLRESLLRSYLGQIEGIADAVLTVAEEPIATRAIADDMAMINVKMMACATLIRARLSALGHGPVRDTTHGDVGVLEDGPASLQDATGDVSSFLHDVDPGDETGRAA